MEKARQILVMLLCAIGILSIGAAAYVFLDVWSVGWTKHDGTITVTIPDNQKEFYFDQQDTQ